MMKNLQTLYLALLYAASLTGQSPVQPRNENLASTATASTSHSHSSHSLNVDTEQRPEGSLPRLEDIASVSLADLVEKRPVKYYRGQREYIDLLFANHPEFKKLDVHLQDPTKVNWGKIAKDILLMRLDAKLEIKREFSQKLNTEIERYLSSKGVSKEDIHIINGIVQNKGRSLRTARQRQQWSQEEKLQYKARRAASNAKWRTKGEKTKSTVPLIEFMGEIDTANRPTPLQLDAKMRTFFDHYPSGHYYQAAVNHYMTSQGYQEEEIAAVTGARAMQRHSSSSRIYMANRRKQEIVKQREKDTERDTDYIPPPKKASTSHQQSIFLHQTKRSRKRKVNMVPASVPPKRSALQSQVDKSESVASINTFDPRSRIDSLETTDWWKSKHL